MLSKIGNKINAWISSFSIFQSDKEWEDKLEREIDAQVDAVFTMINKMDDCTDSDGISKEFNPNSDDSFMKAMEMLDETMKNQKRRSRVSFPVFLVILLASILLVRYSNPAMWVNEKHSLE